MLPHFIKRSISIISVIALIFYPGLVLADLGTWSQTFEALTVGSLHGQDSWVVGSGTISVTTADALTGTKSITIASGAQANARRAADNLLLTSELKIVTYNVKIASLSNFVIFGLYDYDTGPICTVKVGSASTILDGQTSTTLVAPTAGAWTKFEIAVDPTTGMCKSRTDGGAWSSEVALKSYYVEADAHFIQKTSVSTTVYWDDFSAGLDVPAVYEGDPNIYWMWPETTTYSTSTAPHISFGVETAENANIEYTVQTWGAGTDAINDNFSIAAGASTTVTFDLQPVATTSYKISAVLWNYNYTEKLGEALSRFIDYLPDDINGTSTQKAVVGEGNTWSTSIADRSATGCLLAQQSCDDSYLNVGACVQKIMCWAFVPTNDTIEDLRVIKNDFLLKWPIGYATQLFTPFSELQAISSSTSVGDVSTTTDVQTGNIIIPMSLNTQAPAVFQDDILLIDWSELVTASTTEAEEGFEPGIHLVMAAFMAFYLWGLGKRLIGAQDAYTAGMPKDNYLGHWWR